MKKTVQKFGGTSLANQKSRLQAAKHIQRLKESGSFPIIVVSAMGKEGDAYATDTLINLAQKANNTINHREKDLIMSCGEIISTVIMVQTLKTLGIKAMALSGAQAGIITDKNFGKATINSINPQKIMTIIEKGIVPVIAGFQGISKGGEITTLGRGGSDTTASIIAAATGAECIEIYTDVEGVMTADPSLVETAEILKNINYNEVCELAYQGARVIHPRAAEIAMQENIPLKIKSTFKQEPGTVIQNSNMQNINKDRPVTGVTSRHHISFVKISPNNPAEYATCLKIFNLLAKQDISVDFINIRANAISFIVKMSLKEKVESILETNNFNYKISNDFAKVSVVGGGMTGRPGVMAKIVKALTDENINIYQTTDSHTTISCLIEKKFENKSLKVLHEIFSLGDINKEG